MATADPEPVPEAAPVRPEPVATARSGRRFLWLWLVIVAAGLLGLTVGVGVALRGRSLTSRSTVEAVSRPTFVIVASVSPVPSGSPSPVLAGAAPAATYVVQAGDTLRSIAGNVYGDADLWPRIYDANRSVIGPDPDALQAGMRLQIP